MLVYKRGPESNGGLKLPLTFCPICHKSVSMNGLPCFLCRCSMEEGLRRANDAAFENTFRNADEKAKAGSYFNPDDPHEDRSTFQPMEHADNRFAILVLILIAFLAWAALWLSLAMNAGNRASERQIAAIARLEEKVR